MAFDEALATRVRPLLARRKGFSEKKMFGGIGFFLSGNLCAGVWKEFLVVCLSQEASEQAQSQLNVSAFNIYGREKKSWTMIEPDGVESDADLKDWVRRAAKYGGKRVVTATSKPREFQLLPKIESFTGFPNETLKFLRGIRKNNTKKWFDAHRSEYDDFFVAPAKAFVEAVGTNLSKLAPEIVADPKINGSIFRINRDVRFSKDKRPYKDHLDFAFWEGEKKASSSSLFFRVSPDGVFIGAGFHQASPKQLKAFRLAVSDISSGKALANVTKKLRKTGHELQGKHYKRFPRDLPNDGPAAEFLLHNALYVVSKDKPQVACTPDLFDLCIKHWRAALPLHRWLVDNVRE